MSDNRKQKYHNLEDLGDQERNDPGQAEGMDFEYDDGNVDDGEQITPVRRPEGGPPAYSSGSSGGSSGSSRGKRSSNTYYTGKFFYFHPSSVVEG